MSRLKTQNRTLNNASKHITTIILRVLVLSVIIFLVWSQNHLIVSRNYIYSDNDLPKSFVGYKILHISDICNTSNNVVSTAKHSEPDIIVLSGGYQDKNGKYEKTIDIVNKLCNIAPVYYIYNTNDTVDCLSSTQAINITDVGIDLNSGITDAATLIEKAYGKKIIDKANKGDTDALQYMQYINDELINNQYSTIKICGISNMNNASFEDIQKNSYSITGADKNAFTIMLNGNLANLDSLCSTNIDLMLVGGTFGKSSDIASCSKGSYSYLGTQLFVSGGCGNYTSKRIVNLPEVQLITLSDGTIKQNNPIENFLDLFIDDVGTIYDNDGGFSEYTHKYGLGS